MSVAHSFSIGRACRTFPALRQLKVSQVLLSRRFEQLTVIIDSDSAPATRSAYHRGTWFAVSAGRRRSSSSAAITPMAPRAFPPMNAACAEDGAWCGPT